MNFIKIGYPCVNLSISCKANKKFKLTSLNHNKIIETVSHNLHCLKETLLFNIENNILFFRLSSDAIPFASHDNFDFNWQEYFKRDFEEIGAIIAANKIRISAHPGQFTVLNSPDNKVVKKAIKELQYHLDFFKAFNLDKKAKIQIHVGGVYGDKPASIKRFIENYKNLSEEIKNHLVIENDDVSYSLKDCIEINKETGIPVVFDVFHHLILNNGETIKDALETAQSTWKEKDGLMMVDYSSQKPEERAGTHCDHIDMTDFMVFLEIIREIDFECDVMLEIKDKEISAVKALRALKNL